MSDELTPAQNRILEAVASGDLARDASEVLAGARASPRFASVLDSLTAAKSALERTGAQELTDVEATNRESNAPGEHRIAEAVAAFARELPATSRPDPARRLRYGSVLLAAALICIVAWLALRDRPKADPTGSRYLGDSVECIAPAGAGSSFREFRFVGILPKGAWFEVVIRAPGGTELLHSGRLEGNVFALSQEQSDALPAEIEWDVSLRDLGGVKAADSERASR